MCNTVKNTWLESGTIFFLFNFSSTLYCTVQCTVPVLLLLYAAVFYVILHFQTLHVMSCFYCTKYGNQNKLFCFFKLMFCQAFVGFLCRCMNPHRISNCRPFFKVSTPFSVNFVASTFIWGLNCSYPKNIKNVKICQTIFQQMFTDQMEKLSLILFF